LQVINSNRNFRTRSY